MNRRLLSLPLVLATATLLRAQTPAPPPAPGTAAPTEILDPKSLDVLKTKVGMPVTVEGVLVRSGENKAGTIRYLNFTQNYKESISLVFMVTKAPEEFTKEKVDMWVSKKVRATGTVTEFSGQLQLVIEKWDQVVDAP